MIMGVCKGLAQYFDLSVFWVRVVAVLAFIFTGFWPLAGVYFLAALLMKPEPVVPLKDEDEREFYESYTTSRSMAVGRLKRRFEQLDRRLQRMEDIVTSREFDWEQRFSR
jgi:phage shock protein C